jgi:hypothetical protein
MLGFLWDSASRVSSLIGSQMWSVEELQEEGIVWVGEVILRISAFLPALLAGV